MVAERINAQVLADCHRHSDRSEEVELKVKRNGRLSQQQLAQRLVGRVSDRRLFKKALMTSVYGATPYRIRQNLMTDLHKLQLIEGE